MANNVNSSIAYRSIGILGAGAWGTTLALLASRNALSVNVWDRDSGVVSEVEGQHQNGKHLPGISLPSQIHASSSMVHAAGAEALLAAVPAQALRDVLAKLAPLMTEPRPVVVCAKGVEKASGLLMSEVVRAVLPTADLAILSGPSFAADVARGRPTAIAIAGALDTVRRLQATLATDAFRPYGSDDPIGVALGGAAKNVYAIASGIAAGLGLGESAGSALLARSFAELARLGEALGARRETLMGLSGLGDLVLTATSLTSRNYRFGLRLGRGEALALLKAPGEPLAEGVDTAHALVDRARRSGIELPIAEATAAVLDGSLQPGAALARLMSRPLTSE